MDVSTALIADLSELCSDLESGADAIIDAIGALDRDLRLAVRSHLGLQLVLYRQGYPVTLTVLAGVAPGDIATSLHLTLSAFDHVAPGHHDHARSLNAEPGSAVTFYASKPGAVVDLAADLGYLHSRRLAPPMLFGPAASGIRLDQDLDPTTLTSGLVGLADLRTLNRAIGVLMDQGYKLDHARDELSRRSTLAGVTALVCAAELLQSLQR